MTTDVYASDESEGARTLSATVTPWINVRLRIEPNILSTALRQILASNPDLKIEVCPPSHDPRVDAEMPPRSGAARIVEITLLEDPLRFQLEADGRRWIVDYCGLDDLAHRLADLDNWNAAFGWLVGRSLGQ